MYIKTIVSELTTGTFDRNPPRNQTGHGYAVHANDHDLAVNEFMSYTKVHSIQTTTEVVHAHNNAGFNRIIITTVMFCHD